MRAVYYEKTGPAREVFVVGELPDPVPGSGEVRVRVRVAGVNPADVKKRSGWGGPSRVDTGISVPGEDGAGVIDAVGDGVDAGRIGERVWIYNARLETPMGTTAELVTVPAERAVPLPASVGFREGATFGIPAMTAHRALFWDGAIEGQTVLVAGGAGGVGLHAVQLARWGGASVVATVSSEEKATWARRAGAHHVVNYRAEDVVARVRELTDGAGVHRVVEVELGGNLEVSRGSLAPHGVIAAYGSDAVPEVRTPFYSPHGLGMTLHFVVVSRMPEPAKAAAVADITAAAEAGLVSTVGARYPLDQIAAAHDDVERGAVIGKAVVLVTPDAPG